jgi:concentrative nucleoside transporter, CNT family
MSTTAAAMSANVNNAPVDAAVPADVEKLKKGESATVNYRSSSRSTYDEKVAAEVLRDEVEIAGAKEHKSELYACYRPFILAATALVILGWWVSATILEATRHRWIVQTLFAWSFIFIFIFRFVPTIIVSRPVEAVWEPLVQRPFFKLPYTTHLGLG